MPRQTFASRRLSRLGGPEAVNAASDSPLEQLWRRFGPKGPTDFVPLAKVTGPIRLDGRLRVQLLGDEDAPNLQPGREVWVQHTRGWAAFFVADCVPHGKDTALHLDGIGSRDLAHALQGAQIGVPRAQFEPPEPDAHYWLDLIGCAVRNRAGTSLGCVIRMDTNGVHDWLFLDDPAGTVIPFVDAHVDIVDIEAREIQVDWDPAWLGDQPDDLVEVSDEDSAGAPTLDASDRSSDTQ